MSDSTDSALSSGPMSASSAPDSTGRSAPGSVQNSAPSSAPNSAPKAPTHSAASAALNAKSSAVNNSSLGQIEKNQAKPPQGSLIMSGMRSTGRLHIGNYFGALKSWLDLQEEYTGVYGVMDWHAMTSAYKTPHEIGQHIREMVAEWIGWGLDPKKNTIFIQSLVPEHIELFMFFMMLTPMSWAERVPTWKDAEEEAKASDTHNIGRFAYPILQAADIAIYRGTHVPIGQDQIPHLELSRDVIRRFNFLYGGNLPEPKPVFTETPVLPGTDGRKMSKSYGNTFLLTQEPSEVTKTLRGMPTDPARVRRDDRGEPTKCSVYAFHKIFSTPLDLSWVEEGCRTAGIGCGDCKKKLGDNINGLTASPLEKKKELLQKPDLLDSIIADGCQRARAHARETLDQVKSWTGFAGGGSLF